MAEMFYFHFFDNILLKVFIEVCFEFKLWAY